MPEYEPKYEFFQSQMSILQLEGLPLSLRNMHGILRDGKGNYRLQTILKLDINTLFAEKAAK